MAVEKDTLNISELNEYARLNKSAKDQSGVKNTFIINKLNNSDQDTKNNEFDFNTLEKTIEDSIAKGVAKGIEIGVKNGIVIGMKMGARSAPSMKSSNPVFSNSYSGSSSPQGNSSVGNSGSSGSVNINQNNDRDRNKEAIKGTGLSLSLLALNSLGRSGRGSSSGKRGAPSLAGLSAVGGKASTTLRLFALAQGASTAHKYFKTGTEYPLDKTLRFQDVISLPYETLRQDSHGYIMTVDGQYAVDDSGNPLTTKQAGLSKLPKYNPGFVKSLKNKFSSASGMSGVLAGTTSLAAASYGVHSLYTGVKNSSGIIQNTGKWLTESKQYWTRKAKAYRRLMRRPGAKAAVGKKAALAAGSVATVVAAMSYFNKKSDDKIQNNSVSNTQSLGQMSDRYHGIGDTNSNQNQQVSTSPNYSIPEPSNNVVNIKSFSAGENQDQHASISNDDLGIANTQSLNSSPSTDDVSNVIATPTVVQPKSETETKTKRELPLGVMGAELAAGFATGGMTDRAIRQHRKGDNSTSNKLARNAPNILSSVFGAAKVANVLTDKNRTEREKIEDSSEIGGEVAGDVLANKLKLGRKANLAVTNKITKKLSIKKIAKYLPVRYRFFGKALAMLAEGGTGAAVSYAGGLIGKKLGSKVADIKNLAPNKKSDDKTTEENNKVVSIPSADYADSETTHASISDQNLGISNDSSITDNTVTTETKKPRVLSPKQLQYQQHFRGMLDRYGVSSPAELTKEEKSKFFTELKTTWADKKAGISNVESTQIPPSTDKKERTTGEHTFAEIGLGLATSGMVDRAREQGASGNKFVKNIPTMASLGFGAAQLYSINKDKNRTQREKIEDSSTIIGERGAEIALDKMRIGSKINKKVFDKVKNRLPKGAKVLALVAELAAGFAGQYLVGKVANKVGSKVADYKGLAKTEKKENADGIAAVEKLTDQTEETAKAITNVSKGLDQVQKSSVLVSSSKSDTKRSFVDSSDLGIDKESSDESNVEALSVENIKFSASAAKTLGETIGEAISSATPKQKRSIKHYRGQELEYDDPKPEEKDTNVQVINNIAIPEQDPIVIEKERLRKCIEDPNSKCNKPIKKLSDDIATNVAKPLSGIVSDAKTPSVAPVQHVVVDNIQDLSCCPGQTAPSGTGVVVAPTPIEKPEIDSISAPPIPHFNSKPELFKQAPDNTLFKEGDAVLKDTGRPRPPPPDTPPPGGGKWKWVNKFGWVVDAAVGAYNVNEIVQNEDLSSRDKTIGVSKEVAGTAGGIAGGIAGGVLGTAAVTALAGAGAIAAAPAIAVAAVPVLAGLALGALGSWLFSEGGEVVGEAIADNKGDTEEKSDAWYRQRAEEKAKADAKAQEAKPITSPTQGNTSIPVVPVPDVLSADALRTQTASTTTVESKQDAPNAANSVGASAMTYLASTPDSVVVQQGADGVNNVFSTTPTNTATNPTQTQAKGGYTTPVMSFSGSGSSGNSSSGSSGAGTPIATGAALGTGALAGAGSVGSSAATGGVGVAAAGAMTAAALTTSPAESNSSTGPKQSVQTPSSFTNQPTITNEPAAPNKVTKADVAEPNKIYPGAAAMDQRLALAAPNFDNASKVSGVDINTLGKIANIESGFNPTINPVAGANRASANKYIPKGTEGLSAGMSTAHGYGQVLDGTWQDLVTKHGKKYGVIGTGKNGAITKEDAFKYRMDPKVQAGMLAEYSKQGNALGQKYGGTDVDANVYAHHNLGPGEAAALFKAAKENPNAPISSVLEAKTISNNSGLYKPGMTAIQAYNNLGKKMREGQGVTDKLKAKIETSNQQPTTSQQVPESRGQNTPVVNTVTPTTATQNTPQVTGQQTKSDTPPPNSTSAVVRPHSANESASGPMASVTNVSRPAEGVERSQWSSPTTIIQAPQEKASLVSKNEGSRTSVRATLDEVPVSTNDMGMVLLNAGYV